MAWAAQMSWLQWTPNQEELLMELLPATAGALWLAWVVALLVWEEWREAAEAVAALALGWVLLQTLEWVWP